MKVVNLPIEVIASFTLSGEPKPIRFRITEDDELITCDIKLILTKEKLKQAGRLLWKFDCQIVMHNTIKLCEIRYLCESTTWLLFKI